MVKRYSLIITLLFAVSSVIASDHPRLTPSEVLRIADAEARRHGYDVRKFKRPKPRYNFVEHADTWWVNYEPPGPLRSFGDDFSVTVEDKTKKAWLIPGR
jgi:hypothetical protein